MPPTPTRSPEATAAGEIDTETLVAVIKAAFPHRDLPDAAYARAAEKVEGEARKTTWMALKLAQGLDSLQALAGGEGEATFASLDRSDAYRLLLQVQHTAFFGFIRQVTIVNLYEDEEVWERLGYEGPSFDKGGYIDRGFDDLDWLPDPRIEEYDGADQLVDVVPAVRPGGTAAASPTPSEAPANTRGAAVPVGQNKAQAGNATTGREN